MPYAHVLKIVRGRSGNFASQSANILTPHDERKHAR
jgi:hypothetical protein